jgi:diaminopimelate decarboxylase
MVKRTLGHLNVTFVLEPGRMIVGNAGVMVSRVVYVKDGTEKHFVIQDAAMNDLIRPTLYDAYHEIIPVAEPSSQETMLADVVGPVCESGDYLAKGRRLPRLEQGDLIATMTAGAYGAVQACTYNTRPLIAEVLVKDGKWALVRPRQSYEELIGMDKLASWQERAKA